MEETIKKKSHLIRVSQEFYDMLEEVRKHMEKFSYGILEVSHVSATKLLYKKIEKFGGIEKFLRRYRIEVD